jgi:hypothetical protein
MSGGTNEWEEAVRREEIEAEAEFGGEGYDAVTHWGEVTDVF